MARYPREVDFPRVIAIKPGSAAQAAGVAVGDLLVSINGEQPRDVIHYQLLVDEAEPMLEIDRGGLVRSITVAKGDGEPLGLEVQSAIFDQVRTCDNHCSFCFIYQLPKGMRKSLYLKDDDYRLSFLYGNFTTLTRFTEADLERVITEGLSPLYVSIHATDRARRNEMLRNRRGGPSLRWLRLLLDAGIEVHGQVVVCPDLNDGAVLEQTLTDVLNEYPELHSVAVVPLGVSDHSNEPTMRPHTVDEAVAVVDLVTEWQEIFASVLGRRLVYAADEYYLLAGRSFPGSETYGDFAMYEDGIGMARHFQVEFSEGELVGNIERDGRAGGFFASVDGAPAAGYRAPRTQASPQGAGEGQPVQLLGSRPRKDAPIAILTGTYGAQCLEPLLEDLGRDDVRVLPVVNTFFGGNIGVTGLLVGEDLARVLDAEPVGHRYLLPDVCLSEGRFLDGSTPADLPRPVEVVATDGIALRQALTQRSTVGSP